MHATHCHMKFEELLMSLIQLVRFVLLNRKAHGPVFCQSVFEWVSMVPIAQEHGFKEHWGMNRYLLLPTYSKWISVRINMKIQHIPRV